MTKFRGHFVGNHFQASSHFVACTSLRGLEAHTTCTLPYCKSNRIDDLSIESLSYRSLEMQFENLAGLGVRALHFVPFLRHKIQACKQNSYLGKK